MINSFKFVIRESKMLIELNYVFFSLLLVIYSAWRYFKRKERYMLYLTLCFTFLTLSTSLQLLNSLTWVYRTQPIIALRLLELGGLALFACFTICAIITLRKMSKVN